MTLTPQDIERLWGILDEHGREQGDIEQLAQDAIAGGIEGAKGPVSNMAIDCIRRLVDDGVIHPANAHAHMATFSTAFLFGMTIADMGHRERITARRAKDAGTDAQA